MIEAVNSTLSSTPLLRGNAEQVDVARLASNPSRIQEAAPLPQAPYISPYIFVDVNFDRAVLQIRDSETGDVVNQFPSETALQIQRYHSQAQSAAPETTHADSGGSDVSAGSGDTGGAAAAAADAQVAAAALASAAQAAPATPTASIVSITA